MMIEEYTGKSKQKSIDGKRPYVYYINEKKLKELINLIPHTNEELEEKEKKSEQRKIDVDIACGKSKQINEDEDEENNYLGVEKK